MAYSKDIRIAVVRAIKTLKYVSPKRDNSRNLELLGAAFSEIKKAINLLRDYREKK